MNLDISHILKDWPYESGQISARKIRGQDGEDKIQLRVELGILQMETAGRPDGVRPHGHESLLAYYEHLQEHRNPQREDTFKLTARACEQLRNEAIMYYHRYLAEFVLEDYQEVIRDTSRNLRMMDLCNTYAQGQFGRNIMEQFRPYVIMMRTRARGLLAMRDDRPKEALSAIKEGMEEIGDCCNHFSSDKNSDCSGELEILRTLVSQIEGQVPLDPTSKVENELALAIKEERYEDAAVLRDQIHHMKTGEPTTEER